MSRTSGFLVLFIFIIFVLLAGSGPAFILLVFYSHRRDFCRGLVLLTERRQGFVVGGGGDGGHRNIDLLGGVEDPVGSLEDTLVSFLSESHITYMSANVDW